MKEFFTEPIRNLPQANIPIKGLTAYLSQSSNHQTLFMSFEKDTVLAEHLHVDQVGFILEGKIELTVNAEIKTYKKGESYHVPSGVLHSVKIYAPYADITVFMEKERYKPKH